MRNVRHEIADRACMRTGPTLSLHISYDLFESLEEGVWDPINDRIWFGFHEIVRGRISVSITPDLVTIKVNRPE